MTSAKQEAPPARDASKSDAAAPMGMADRRVCSTRLIGRLDRAKRLALEHADRIRTHGLLLPDRHDCTCPFTGRKRRDLLVAAQGLHDCSGDVLLRDFFDLGRVTVEALRCRQHLVCPVCAIFRGARFMASVCEHLAAYRRQCGPMRLSLLTRTMPADDDLRRQLAVLASAAANCWAHRNPTARRSGTPMAGVEGGYRSVEVKRGSGSGRWHVHTHDLLLHRDPLDVEHVVGRSGRASWRWPAMSDWWERRTGACVVECHPVTASASADPRDDRDAPAGGVQQLTTAADTASLLGAVCEISKYAVKLNGVAGDDLLEVWGVCRGVRLVQGYGCLRYSRPTEARPGLRLFQPDAEREAADDERALLDVAAYLEASYRWRGGEVGYDLSAARVVPDSIPF